MFGMSRSGAAAYAKVDLETSAASANPHTLIVMLFDGALVALRAAIVHMQEGNIEKKGNAISKAILIVQNGLRASLDKSAGGQIAENLDSLYDYLCRRMLEANIKNDRSMISEVIAMLADLKGAWESIGETKPALGPAATPRLPASDNLVPRMASLAVLG